MLLLSGCIGRNQWVWQHPSGYGEQEKQQAITDCEAIANAEARHYAYPFPYPHYYDRFYYRDERFLYFPQYYHYLNQWEFEQRRRFFRICMKSKGWRLVKLPALAPQQ